MSCRWQNRGVRHNTNQEDRQESEVQMTSHRQAGRLQAIQDPKDQRTRMDSQAFRKAAAKEGQPTSASKPVLLPTLQRCCPHGRREEKQAGC